MGIQVKGRNFGDRRFSMQFFRLASILGLVSIGVLHHTSVMAEQPEAETGGDEELRRALAVLDSTTDRVERVQVLHTLEKNSVCRVMLGASGELITRGPHNPSAPEGTSLWFLVVPEDDRYRLVQMDISRPDLGLELGDTYARIAADGTFELFIRMELRRLLPLSPDRWPMKEIDATLFFPDEMVVIAHTRSLSNPGQAYVPGGAIGWCLLEWDGHLIAPNSEVERPENFLWVVKTKDGIQFVHSGPLRAGVYATISGDRLVTYGNGAPERLRLRKEPDWWPFEKDGAIVPIPAGRIGIPGIHDRYAVWDGDTLICVSSYAPIY